MASDLIDHAYIMKPLWKRRRMGFQELLDWETPGDAGRMAYPESMEAQRVFPHTLPYAVPELYFYKNKQTCNLVNKLFSYVLWATLAN